MKKPVFYETRAALEQYLFFHYGTPSEYLPWPGPVDALNYPARALDVLLDRKRLPPRARALDLGCAVGRTSFELSSVCDEVIGIDLSRTFIRAANRMKTAGKRKLSFAIEGERRGETVIRIPGGCHPSRIRFLAGDAMNIPRKVGTFDVAVLLNLIDRVPDPGLCLKGVLQVLNPGAQLLVASPYTWMSEYTPKSKWLGGRPRRRDSFSALTALLEPHCRLQKRVQIPFLIREHARKFQWSMAEGTSWIVRS